jgi:hypothetical protein
MPNLPNADFGPNSDSGRIINLDINTLYTKQQAQVVNKKLRLITYYYYYYDYDIRTYVCAAVANTIAYVL